MATNAFQQTCRLTPQAVDDVSARTVEVLEKNNMEHENVVRLRLAVENVLLKWMDVLGQEAEVVLTVRRRFRRHALQLSVKGPQVNPFEIEDELDREMARLAADDSPDSALEAPGRAFLSVLGLAPSYTYLNGENRLLLMIKKKPRRPLITLLVSVGLALIVGALCSLLPSQVGAVIANNVITPLFDTFMGFLSALAGPMMFLAVIWGIYSIGDISTLGVIGRRLLSHLALTLTGALLIALLIALPFITVSLSGSTAGSGGVEGVYMLILSIIPDNFVAPFAEKNSLQIVFVAVIIGFAALLLSRKTMVFAQFVEQSNFIVQLIMEVVSLMVPGVIFLSIVNMFLSQTLGVLADGARLILLFLAAAVLIVAAQICLLAFRTRTSPLTVLRKLMPTFVIAVSTASSSAAFATNMLSCERGLGIQRKLVNFAVPLGTVTYMPVYGALLLLSAICMAQAYGVTITPLWLVTALLLAWILSIANPPIPGGGMACYTILFTQLGLPAEALILVFALETLADYVVTACDIASLQIELAYVADRLGMLDRGTLGDCVHDNKNLRC